MRIIAQAYRKVICCRGRHGFVCLADRMLFGLSGHVQAAHRRSASTAYITRAYWHAH